MGDLIGPNTPHRERSLRDDVADLPAEHRVLLPHIALRRHEQIIEGARRSPTVFLSHVLRDEQTGKRIKLAPMHVEWQRLLTKHDRLILWAHVESGKTSAISIGRALYEVGRNPQLRVCIISKTKGLAQKIVRSCQQIVSGETESAQAFREVFPHVRPAYDPSLPWTSLALTIERAVPSKDPTIQASGAFGNIIGSRIDLLIIDDVLDSTSTRTPAPRTALWDWMHGTVVGRLTEDSRVWALGNAYHPDDYLHRLEKVGRYKAYRFPVIDPATKLPAWPERWSAKRIEDAKLEFGPLDYARALFCQPRDDDSARFKREWVEVALRQGEGLKFLSTRADLLKELALASYADSLRVGGHIDPQRLRIYIGVDLAVQLHSAADMTAFVIVAVLPDGTRRLLWIEAGHWGAPEILGRIKRLDEAYQPTAVIVENNAAQAYIVQLAHAETAVPVIPFTTGKQKAHPEFGVEGIAAELVAQKWIFPCDAVEKMHPELFALVSEILSYDPRSHSGDRLMGMWFAREGARMGMHPAGSVSVTVCDGSVQPFENERVSRSAEQRFAELVEDVVEEPAELRPRFLLVVPHTDDEAALEATEAALQGIGGRFVREADGGISRRGGMLLVTAGDPSYVAWAAEKQGYVRRAVIPDP